MKEKKIDPEIRNLLKEECVKYRTAMFLQNLDKAERPLLFRLFKEIKLGVNKQREIIEWLDDVCKRDSGKMNSVLKTLELEKTLDDIALNAPQKADLFRDRLFELRFPEVSRYLAGLRGKLKKLALPEKAKIVPLTPLEDGEFRIEVVFNSDGDLKESLEKIGTLVKNGELRGLWETEK
jgi:hypothetical protein